MRNTLSIAIHGSLRNWTRRDPRQLTYLGVLVTVLSPAAMGSMSDVRAVWILAMIGCHGDVGGRC